MKPLNCCIALNGIDSILFKLPIPPLLCCYKGSEVIEHFLRLRMFHLEGGETNQSVLEQIFMLMSKVHHKLENFSQPFYDYFHGKTTAMEFSKAYIGTNMPERFPYTQVYSEVSKICNHPINFAEKGLGAYPIYAAQSQEDTGHRWSTLMANLSVDHKHPSMFFMPSVTLPTLNRPSGMYIIGLF